jgi:hypothetical protein
VPLVGEGVAAGVPRRWGEDGMRPRAADPAPTWPV